MIPIERDEFVDAVQEGLLELLTTPKYRYLSSIYLLFRLGDKAMLLALVYCTLTGYVWQEELQQSLEIITVLTAEAAYEVLEMGARFWFMNRILPVVGLGLYAAYALVFWRIEEHSPDSFRSFVWLFLLIRLVSFVLELLADYCIDIEIHSDICAGTITGWSAGRFFPTQEISFHMTEPEQTARRVAKPLLQAGGAVKPACGLASSSRYRGSICAWSLRNASAYTPPADGAEVSKFGRNVSRGVLLLLGAPVWLFILLIYVYSVLCECRAGRAGPALLTKDDGSCAVLGPFLFAQRVLSIAANLCRCRKPTNNLGGPSDCGILSEVWLV